MNHVLKQLPRGFEDYRELCERNRYYVDKTAFIKKVFAEDDSKVLLITRPRRFGKTLTMSMFKYFLELNHENPGDVSLQQSLFKGKEIMRDNQFCSAFMGQYPVILLSLKEVCGADFEESCNLLAITVSLMMKRYAYLLNSNALSDDDQHKFRLYLNSSDLRLKKHRADLCVSLRDLSEFFYQYFGKQVVLLIDEYDVPLAKAEEYGYYDDMVKLMRVFLSSALKTNNAVFKAVLTGCLRVSKESIFTGVNNFSVNSVFTEIKHLATSIGFTPEEVRNMLEYYDLEGYSNQVKHWYDGYRIADHELYCPWDVVNFCSDAYQLLKEGREHKILFNNYWIGTSSNAVIKEYMPYLNEQEAERMQRLLDGESIEFSVNEQLNYNEIRLNHGSDDFWTLLLYTGYLTVVSLKKVNSMDLMCTARIPNEEIRSCFEQNVLSYYKTSPKIESSARNIAQLLQAGEADQAADAIESVLENYVSVRDFATRAKAENYYHGFLNGLFSSCGDCIDDYRSNQEGGDGYADIMFRTRDRATGVVLELKSVKSETELDAQAATALKQIEDKEYYQGFKKRSLKRVYCYGIAFFRKECSVEMSCINVPFGEGKK